MYLLWHFYDDPTALLVTIWLITAVVIAGVQYKNYNPELENDDES